MSEVLERVKAFCIKHNATVNIRQDGALCQAILKTKWGICNADGDMLDWCLNVCLNEMQKKMSALVPEFPSCPTATVVEDRVRVEIDHLNASGGIICCRDAEGARHAAELIQLAINVAVRLARRMGADGITEAKGK